MPLILRAISVNDHPITRPITGRFGPDGGSIGRADTNTLALPDPERRISRRQADITAAAGSFVIKNVGSANPIIVGDQSLALGESAPLRVRDQIRIGGYLLEVSWGEDGENDRTAVDSSLVSADPFASIPPASLARGPNPPQMTPAFPPSSPFADLGSPISTGNPFAELLGDPSLSRSAPAPATSSAPAPSRLPDDFDPFAPPPISAAPPPRPATSSAGGAFDDLIPSAAPASIDSLFGLGAGGAQDPLAAFLAQVPPTHDQAGASSNSLPLSTDPLDHFGGEESRKAVTSSAPTLADQTPELRAAFVPPKPQPTAKPATPLIPPVAPPTAPSAASAAAATESGAGATSRPTRPAVASSSAAAEESTVPPATGWPPDALAVWSALCEGAGVRLDPPPNTGPAFMRVVGMMLRASVEGTVQLMAMRQATRQELQAQVTVIRPRNNNPLKFAPDGQSAMEQVLQPAVRGFLPGPAAVTDAMNDLLSHAIGTMAGTRAALEGVLKRFGPQELEAKLTDNSVLDSVLPMNRKAKLWELYLQHYDSIRDEAQEDFHTLFGRAFLAAYEQQLERLRRNKSAAPK